MYWRQPEMTLHVTCRRLVGVSVCCMEEGWNVKMEGRNALALLLFAASLSRVSADHFHGGHLNWFPTDQAGQVKFVYGLTVRREGENTKCNQFNLGDFTVDGSADFVASGPGLDDAVIGRNDYVCTSFSIQESLVQGEGSFLYTFPDPQGVYSVRLAECCLPSYANSAEFVLATTVDLRHRNDTGSPNNPPVSTTPPLVFAVEGCSSMLQLLVADSDQDEVRCREVETSECGRGGCVPLPSWVNVDSSCTVSFTTVPRGEHYVSLVVEDFTAGSSIPLASMTLSFTVIVDGANGSCLTQPEFDSDVTPVDGSCDTVLVGGTYRTYVLVTPPQGQDIADLFVSAPSGLSQTRRDLEGRAVLFTLVWTPASDQYGTHVVSFFVIDTGRQSSELRSVLVYTGVSPVQLIAGSNVPNTQVTPNNSEWNISFAQSVQLSAVRRLIYLEQIFPERNLLEAIDVSSSPLVRTEGNTLFITLETPLVLNSEYQINLESSVVIPHLSCPQQPGQSGFSPPPDFTWTFTAQYGPCYRNCSAACVPEVWQRDLCVFYEELELWVESARQCGLDLPGPTPSQQGTSDEQWAEARNIWGGINAVWLSEAARRGFGEGERAPESVFPGNPLNAAWSASLELWFQEQVYWEATVGSQVAELPLIFPRISPSQWPQLLSNWTVSSDAYSTAYQDQCLATT